MSLSKPPALAKTWKTKRQTRVKPSGMTKLLEKWDMLWKTYDPQKFIKEVMGTGDDGLRDIQRNIDGFAKASDEISALAKTNDNIYDKGEKAVIKELLGDIDEEIAFWKEKKKRYVLEEGGAKVATDKLVRVAEALDAAMDRTEARAKQLGALHGKLSAADNLADHRPPPAVLQAFRKGVEEFGQMLKEASALDVKLQQSAAKVGNAYPKDTELLAKVTRMESARDVHSKRLKPLWGAQAVWRLWADRQVAAATA